MFLFMPLTGLNARVPPQIDRLAAQTAKRVAKTDGRRILTTPLSGCLGAPQLCTEFDAVLRANLEKLIPDAKFIEREEAVKHLSDHGFLGVDAYMGALDDVASDAGADVVVGEDFQRRRGVCILRTTLADAKHLFSLGGLFYRHLLLFGSNQDCALALEGSVVRSLFDRSFAPVA
jgi:hypothetical protein